MAEQQPKLKEDLSRMQAAYGAKMVGKLKQLKMAIFGLDGLGVETAKNLLLTGPGAVAVHDDTVVTAADLGVNFYCRASDVGERTRSAACSDELRSINPNVNFSILTGAVTPEVLGNFNVVIFTDDRPQSELVAHSDWCHANNVTFIYATATGLFGTVFTDFGEQHEVFDKTGEAERHFPIESIYVSETSGLVEIVLDSDEIKLLDDDDHVSISNVEGMDGINGAMVQIKVDPKNKRRLVVQKSFARVNADAAWEEKGDGAAFATLVKSLSAYSAGGIVKTVKVPEFFDYLPFGKSLEAPVFCENHIDFSKQYMFGMGFDNLHATRRTLLAFQDANSGELPKLHSTDDAQKCVSDVAPKIFSEGVDANMVTKAALFARTRHNGLCAFLGGIVAQEAMKRTGKYTPLRQWFHYEALEIIPTTVAEDMVLDAQNPSRYDHQIALFGRGFQEKVFNLKVFQVGCGALGCEYLKNLALMGVGCGGEGTSGAVHITDDDVIELSNLSRQFLFRRQHVKKLKSASAGAVAATMNPDLKHGLHVHETRVEPKTETEFTDKFWDELDFVVNALDNVKARTYTDSKCLLHSVPLFESGTLSTKASLSVHLPFKSDHYHDTDTNTGPIAMCTLTNFPFLASHCVGWAKNMFRDMFEVGAGYFNKLQKDPAAFLRNISSASPDEQKEMLRSTLAWDKYSKIPDMSDKTAQLAAVVQVGAEAYDKFFDTAIRKLTNDFPRDLGQPGGPPNVDKETGVDMGPFWRGRKRFPRAASDRSSPRYVNFVFHTACIMCDILGLDRPSLQDVQDSAPKIPYKAWDAESDEAANNDDDIETLLEQLNNIPTTGKTIQEMEFEKDEDDNHHIDWITAACNERSYNYYIDESTSDYVRVTAGNILAAIATATASICGIQMIEITKKVLDVEPSKHKGLTMDLSTCNFVLEDIADVITFKEREVVEDEATGVKVLHKVAPAEGFSVWDTLKIHNGAKMTGSELAAHIKQQFPDVVTKELYAKSHCLWQAGGAGKERSLFEEFESAMTSGKTSGHSVKTIKRVRNELKELAASPLDGVELFVNDADIFNIEVLVAGPSGSPYEKGLFRLSIVIPSQYPLAPPKVTFKTKIFHCNVTTAGSPCPNLLYGAEWSPKKNIRFMLVQVLELLANQSPADSLNSSAGKLFNKSADEFAAAASDFVAQHANPESERALLEASQRATTAAQGQGSGDAEKFEWPHNYLVLEGDFASADGQAVYDLPRIQLFLDSSGEAAAAKPAASATATPLPADSALAKAIMATKFEVEDVEFTPQKVYHMSDERSATYLKSTDNSTGQFTVAVVCMNEDEEELEELVLLIPDGEAAIAAAAPGLSEDHYTILVVTDVIMAEDTSVANCIEYRFGPEDSWTLCATSADNMEGFRSVKFELYEKNLKAVPVPCLKSLSRMLGNGPVDRLFDPNFLNPDREAWQVLNEDTGKVTDIPRPVAEMRLWNCETQSYEDFDTRLEGAPDSGEAAKQWFVDAIKFVKKNLGGMNTSLEIATVWSQELNEKMGQLGFTNQWTDLVLSLSPSEEWGLNSE